MLGCMLALATCVKVDRGTRSGGTVRIAPPVSSGEAAVSADSAGGHKGGCSSK
jgi:hypothetical protein